MLKMVGALIHLLSRVAHFVEDEARETADKEDLYALKVYLIHLSRYLHGEIFVVD